MSKFALALILVLFLGSPASAADAGVRDDPKKRDPFVALVDPDGRMRTQDELSRAPQKILPAAIILKGIIWDAQRPLAVISGKVYAEGAAVSADITLEKINKDGVVLKTSDNQKINIELKKREKK
ncbi:MAG: hypothetical protein ACOY3D_03695 [Candidatus Omnitrophota bacterium]